MFDLPVLTKAIGSASKFSGFFLCPCSTSLPTLIQFVVVVCVFVLTEKQAALMITYLCFSCCFDGGTHKKSMWAPINHFTEDYIYTMVF